MRSIEDLSKHELDAFEASYRREKKTEGGIFSLSEILLEKQRRRPTVFGVREVAIKIVELASTSKDGFVTYGEIWQAFRPHEPWMGHKTLRVVANALGRVVHYCVTHGLPILTVLVVRSSRRLSDKAIQNIYNECRDLGVDVGLDPKAFVDSQVKLSRNIVIGQLPDDG